MLVLESMTGNAVPGKTLEKLEEVVDRAIKANGYRKTTTIGGQTEQCYLLRDSQGNIIESGSPVCLQMLKSDLVRISNPLFGQTNNDQMRGSEA